VARLSNAGATIATLGLAPLECTPLRLTASIALAEVARQAGKRHPQRGRADVRRPVYELALPLGNLTDESVELDPRDLLIF
jgi:hypothetical protein